MGLPERLAVYVVGPAVPALRLGRPALREVDVPQPCEAPDNRASEFVWLGIDETHQSMPWQSKIVVPEPRSKK